MARSLSFGSTACNYVALFRLAFATAPCLRHLTLLHTITHRLIMQKARRQPTEVSLRLLVSAWYQVLFHSPPGVLFTFPSRYWFTIGSRRILSLSRWSCWIPARFLVSRGTWEHHRKIDPFHLRGYHPLWPDFPDRSAMNRFCNSLEDQRLFLKGPATPSMQRPYALTH